jgi:hypothetical protein
LRPGAKKIVGKYRLKPYGQWQREKKQMIQIKATFNTDDGSVMVAALLILVLLTIIGISATTMSNSELNITTNMQLHKMAFFTAESGWHVMTDWLDDQYPLPTVDLGSDKSDGEDSTDNDGDGLTDELDEYILFTTAKAGSPDMLPFSDSKSDFQYGATAVYFGAGIAPGWDPTMFLRYNYQITSTASVPARIEAAVSQITVTAGKIENIGS